MTTAIRPVLASFIVRSVTLWVLTRTVITGVVRSAETALPLASAAPAHPLSVAPATALLVAALVTALVLNDVRVMHERAFLANIGVGLRAVASLSFAVAASLEIALALLLSVVQ